MPRSMHEVPECRAPRFTTHHTRRGDWIVRDAGRDLARVATEAEATALATQAREEAEAWNAAAAAAAREDHRFLEAAPALVARQLAWQQWRTAQYDALCAEGRYVASLDRQAARIGARATVHRAEREATARGWAAAAHEDLAAADARYHELVALDAATKRAIGARDAAAWASALDACDGAMGAGR